MTDYQKKKNGVVSVIYSTQKSHSKTRGHRPPDYTKNELKDWLFSQELFHKLYNEWKISGYKSRLKPSIDRIDDEIHYCFSNIKLITWGENKTKGHKNRANGISTQGSVCKPVIAICKKTNKKLKFISLSDGARSVGSEKDIPNIHRAIKQQYRTCKGYYWRYA